MKPLIALVLLASCFAVPAPQVASQADVEAMSRESTARSMGYPTKQPPAALDQMIEEQTKSYQLAVKQREYRLEAPEAFQIEGKKGTCYKFVLRLGDGAVWGRGAEAGLRFDYRSPTGPGSGGPGVKGPGAVASVGCAEANGPITMMMAPMVGRDPIGQGPVLVEVWSKVLTKAEQADLQADKERQIREQQEFAAREAAKKQAREARGCSMCDGRYQGCVGAGRSERVCRDEYSSCAFQQAGANYLSVCPSPNR